MWVIICIGVQFLFSAVTGVLGINGMTPRRFWPFWPFMVICVALAGMAAWVAVMQQKESDVRYESVHGQLTGVQTQLGEQKTTLQNLTGQNTKLQGAITKLGTAAHIPVGTSLDDLVNGIADKLPKPSVAVKGNNNTTSVGQSGGITAGTINAGTINTEKPDRELTAADKAQLLKLLPDKSVPVQLQYVMGSLERQKYAQKVEDFLNASGYGVTKSQVIVSNIPKGGTVGRSPDGKSMVVLIGEN